jgi:hypothetical protein
MKNLKIRVLIACLMVIGISKQSFSQQGKIKLGAYYYDGWSGKASGVITPYLKSSYSNREPSWGWVTSTPELITKQIDMAVDAGLSFFDFDWYFPENNKQHFQDAPLNNALKLFLAAPNNSKLGFCLLVANHQDNIIGPEDWETVTDTWIQLFKKSNYVTVNGKPLITFFTMTTLMKTFGTPEAIHKAMDRFKAKAVSAGLKGVTIAACCPPPFKSNVDIANSCGFDIVTGYNYHGVDFTPSQTEYPISSLVNSLPRVWNSFKTLSLPFIPVITLNWDNRAWTKDPNTPHYKGFSSKSVYQSVQAAKKWINANPQSTTAEKIAVIYAWNEYVEGSWLTPTKQSKDVPLNGVKKALSTY